MRNLTALTAPDARATSDKARTYLGWVKSLAAAKGDGVNAREIFAANAPIPAHVEVITRAAVEAGSTTGWGAELSPVNAFASAFLDLVRPRTILGRMSGVVRAPFDVRIPEQTGGVTPGWTAEGKPILVASGEFSIIQQKRSKIGGIVVLTDELVRSSDPSAESIMQRDLGAGIIEFSDRAFVDPAVAEVPDVSPASITNGAPEITSTGATAAAVEADMAAMVQSLIDGGVALAYPHWIMSPENALFLSRLRGPGGERIFPNVGVLGGTIWEIPVIAAAGARSTVALIDAAEVLLSDDGLEIDVAKHASLQMDSEPGDDPASNVVSLWQLNLVALRAIRHIRWRRRNDAGVAWMTVNVPEAG